jgi:hypothetical protein
MPRGPSHEYLYSAATIETAHLFNSIAFLFAGFDPCYAALIKFLFANDFLAHDTNPCRRRTLPYRCEVYMP